jgi:hypothetical protein
MVTGTPGVFPEADDDPAEERDAGAVEHQAGNAAQGHPG